MSTPEPGPLSGQSAVVTGGGRGIGAAIARRLAAMGAAVAIAGRRRDTLDETCRAITEAGGRCEGVLCDVTSFPKVQALATRAEFLFGKVDILVNNAGVATSGGPLHDLPIEEWDAVMNTNLRGVFYGIKAFAPLMIKAGGGHIVNISSIAAKNPLPNGAAYGASKWGLNGLSYSVAEELRAHNIRVSVVCPGSTMSELSPHYGKDPSKMLQGEDVAHVVAMLVTQSPQSFASEVVLRPTRKP